MSFGTVQAEKVTTQSGYTLGAGNASSFKNRIINGGMTIDQRNAGAAVTTNSAFVTDRFSIDLSQTSKISFQQSSTAPAGFINSLAATSSSAYSIGAGDYFQFTQNIEGLNMADFAWGTASATTVTLSFWVRSSLTGAFGGSIRNNALNRSYPFTYTINSANTFEYKTITIPGDQSGTWLTTNGIGLRLTFGLGNGSTYSGTAGSWASANYQNSTGATSLVGTNGATFYITGVQLEVGTVATSFDYRPYGTELALCQRYYYQVPNWFVPTGTNAYLGTYHRVSMRATPTLGGGGAGFTTSANNTEAFLPYQTTGAYITLTVSAEL
jgi:hypothetical protein